MADSRNAQLFALSDEEKGVPAELTHDLETFVSTKASVKKALQKIRKQRRTEAEKAARRAKGDGPDPALGDV